VIQVLQNLEGVTDNAMALLTSDMGHKTNATGIVFAGRRIQTVVLKMLDFGSRSHGALLKNENGGRAYRTAAKTPSTLIGVRFQFKPEYRRFELFRDTLEFYSIFQNFKSVS
jgi:hypothetical protein